MEDGPNSRLILNKLKLKRYKSDGKYAKFNGVKITAKKGKDKIELSRDQKAKISVNAFEELVKRLRKNAKEQSAA